MPLDTPAETQPADTAAAEDPREAGQPEVTEELLVEEVSIDGMCGVY